MPGWPTSSSVVAATPPPSSPPSGRCCPIRRSPPPSRRISRPASRRSRPGAAAWTRSATGSLLLADPYQRERAADVRSVQRAVLQALTGTLEDEPDPDSPVVLVVDELDVATATSVDPGQVAGIVVAARGRTGHGAIVAGSRGIPLFTGAGAAARSIIIGQRVAFDARRSRLWTSVSDEQAQRWPAYVAERQAEHAALSRGRPGARGHSRRHRDPGAGQRRLARRCRAGRGVRGGRVGTGPDRAAVRRPPRSADGGRAVPNGCDGWPDAFGDRPMVVRTWDVGGDKTLPFLPLPREANPFLGVRGVRAFLGPEAPLPARLLADQLAAIALTAPGRGALPDGHLRERGRRRAGPAARGRRGRVPG